MNQTIDSVADRLLSGGFFLAESVELLEKAMIAKALARTGGNRSEASKLLGIHRNTLQKKMTEFKLEPSVRRKPPQKAGQKARQKTGTSRRVVS